MYEYFQGVSCRSSRQCIAVGTADDIVLTGYWNGATWTISTPTNVGTGGLDSVSCPSRNACFAVGSGGDSGIDPLLMEWNGMTWSDRSSAVPNPDGGMDFGAPVAISCPSATACTAVGSAIYPWSGGRWKLEPLRGDGLLEAVSCVSRAVCVAVGQNSSAAPFVMRRT
jgi:hypothetical protein